MQVLIQHHMFPWHYVAYNICITKTLFPWIELQAICHSHNLLIPLKVPFTLCLCFLIHQSTYKWLFPLQEESQLTKITRDSAKITVEQVHGLMSQVSLLPALLFHPKPPSRFKITFLCTQLLVVATKWPYGWSNKYFVFPIPLGHQGYSFQFCSAVQQISGRIL